MKRYSIFLFAFFSIFSCCANVSASENVEYVENYDITITFNYGTRTGTYSGSLKNGLPDGFGKFSSENNAGTSWTYIGEWDSGHFSGDGFTTYEDGTIKLGIHEDDFLINGQILTSSDRYSGEVKNDLPQGNGIYFLENGCRYEGSFSSGNFNGDGVYYFPNGDYITGTFTTNPDTHLTDATGTYHCSDGKVSPCRFENGNLLLDLENDVSINSVVANTVTPTPTLEPLSPISITCNSNVTIYENEIFSIKIENMVYDSVSHNYQIEFMATNHSKNSLLFSLDNSDIDGFQVSAYTKGNSIDSGKRGILSFSISENSYIPYGINDFEIWNTILTVAPYGSEAILKQPLKIFKESFVSNSNPVSNNKDTSKLSNSASHTTTESSYDNSGAKQNIIESAPLSVEYGKLLEVNPNGGGNGNTLVVKVKIEPNLTNRMTIEQNYLNIIDIVKNKGFDQFDSIDYWAVADMSDGSEAKVISFLADKNCIDAISNGTIASCDTLEKHLSDLWILPSLQE